MPALYQDQPGKNRCQKLTEKAIYLVQQSCSVCSPKTWTRTAFLSLGFPQEFLMGFLRIAVWDFWQKIRSVVKIT